MRGSRKPILLLSVIVFLVGFQVQYSYGATISLAWEFPGGYSLNDGGVGSFPVFFSVTDPSFAANSVFDTISVTITSIMPNGTTRDSTTLTLHEIDSPTPSPIGRNPDPNSGIFGTNRIVFSPDTARFSVGNTATVTKNDTSKAGNGIVDTISVMVKSTTDTSGISLTLKETGANTGIFTGKIKFDASSSVANSSIHVSAGDIVTVRYLGLNENVAIIPSPDGSTSGLKTDVGDTVMISYLGHNANTTICVCGGGGGGGGGLIRPGLVLDVLTAIGGKGGERVLPPSLPFNRLTLDALALPEIIKSEIRNQDTNTPLSSLNDSYVNLPLTINGRGYPISLYGNTIVTNTVKVGKPVTVKLLFHDYYDVTHVGLFTNLRDSKREIQDSDTYVEYDKNSPLAVTDPHNFISNVTVSTSRDGDKQSFVYNFTFAKPMKKSDIIIRAWNERRSSMDTKIYDAWKIVEPDPVKIIIQNKTITNDTKIENTTSTVTINPNVSKGNAADLKPVIRMWIGQANQSISDSDLLTIIGVDGKHIPKWVEKTGKLLSNGEISQQEFLGVIKYLADKNMIR